MLALTVMVPTVSTKALRAPILAAAARSGRSPADLAALIGVLPTLVTDPDARVEHSVVASAWDTLADVSGEPHLGLFAVSLLDAAPVDLVDLALQHARDLRGLLDCFSRFQRLYHDANDCTQHIEGDQAVSVFSLRPEAARSRHLCEFVLGNWTRKARRILGDCFVLTEVRLRDSGAEPPALFRQIFGAAPVRFGAGVDALVYSASLLDAPVAGADEALRALLEKQLERTLASRAPDAAFLDVARHRLRVALTQGGIDAEQLARALAVSTRSLQRRLAELGTTFSDLLDEVRRDLALGHLEHPDVSVTEVAFLLGFSDLSSFSRAFRRWTGKSPAEHRRKHAA